MRSLLVAQTKQCEQSCESYVEAELALSNLLLEVQLEGIERLPAFQIDRVERHANSEVERILQTEANGRKWLAGSVRFNHDVVRADWSAPDR